MMSESSPNKVCDKVSELGNKLAVEHSQDILELAKPSESVIQVGDKAILVQSRKSIPVTVVELIYDANMMISYKVKLPD